MADPVQSYIFGGKLSTATSQEVKAYNSSTGESLSVYSDSADGSFVFDAANFSSGYNVGDVVLIETRGSYVGSTTHTIGTDSQSGANVTVSSVSGGAVSL